MAPTTREASRLGKPKGLQIRLSNIRRLGSNSHPPQCPVMAMSGSKRRNRAASAQGQEADIAVHAFDPHFKGYAKPWFSVQPTPGQFGGWACDRESLRRAYGGGECHL